MKLDFLLLDASYVDDVIEVDAQQIKKGTVKIIGKTDNNETVECYDRSYYPYLYYMDKNIDKAKTKLKKITEQITILKDFETVQKKPYNSNKKIEVLKLYTYHPAQLQKVRKKLANYNEFDKDNFKEYSINFYRRYLIEKSLSPTKFVSVEGKEIDSNSQFHHSLEIDSIENTDKHTSRPYKELAFDIESYTDSDNQNKIIMISLVSGDTEKVLTYRDDQYSDFVEVLENEKNLLERFAELVNEIDPDIIYTYNGDAFDFQIIEDRIKEYDLDFKIDRYGNSFQFARRARNNAAWIDGRVHIDLYSFVEKVLESHLKTEVLSLNAVSKEITSNEKIDVTHEEMKNNWLENANLDKIAKYNLRDSQITLELAKNLLPLIFSLSEIVGQIPFDVTRMTYGQLVEWFLMKKSDTKNILPDRPKYNEIQERRNHGSFEGGFVKEPITGLHENIAVLDFKSLYPTIIVTYNISPDTLKREKCFVKNEVPDSDIYFCNDEIGFIPSVLEDIIQERTKIKEKLKGINQDSSKYKKYDNRQYALKVLANSVYGYFGYPGARWYSRDCASAITKLGRKWIKEVMDDAKNSGFKIVYGDTDSLMIKNGDFDKFVQDTNENLPGIMELELEGVFKRGIFVTDKSGKGAKKRYALVDKNDKLKVKGFETVRRDWSPLAKKLQRDVIEKILVDNDVDKAVQHTKNIVKKIKDKDINLEEIVINTKLSKPLEEYKTRSPHIAAARKLKDMDEVVESGKTISYVITEGSGSISDRSVPSKTASVEDIDSDYYVENQVIPAALRVLKVFDVDKKELLGKGHQENLEGFA